MHMPNPTIPQAKFFFVYLLWLDQEPNPLQTHVVFGFDAESLAETRRLVESGAQIKELLYLSEVCPLESYHRRSLIEALQGTDGGSRPNFSPGKPAAPASTGDDEVIVPLEEGIAVAAVRITGGG